MNDNRLQFSIMNNIVNDIVYNKGLHLALWMTFVIHNPIPTTWAKLVQSSFAKNVT